VKKSILKNIKINKRNSLLLLHSYIL